MFSFLKIFQTQKKMKKIKKCNLESISGGTALPCIVVGALIAGFSSPSMWGNFGYLSSDISRCWNS